MKIQNISDVNTFFKVIDSCKGTVELVSPEGDRINLKSKLSQYLSMANIFSNGYIKELELATMSFGQSFQITPLQLMRAISCVINGGTLITPHFGVRTIDSQGNINTLEYESVSGVITPEVSNTMKMLLKSVVSEGGGGKCYIEGYSIGGKTATSQKLPRSEHKYIASFIGFAPAENPQVMAMCIIDEPQGIYYGGTIAAPVVREVFENILPYLGIEQSEKGTK